MPVSSICSKILISVQSNATLLEAARLMKEVHIGAVVVVNSKAEMKPVGVLTDRDLVLAIANGFSLSEPVETAMSHDLVTIYETESISSATIKMRTENVRRLVVLDSSEKAVSLLSSDDVIRRVATEIHDVGCLFASQPMKEASEFALGSNPNHTT